MVVRFDTSPAHDLGAKEAVMTWHACMDEQANSARPSRACGHGAQRVVMMVVMSMGEHDSASGVIRSVYRPGTPCTAAALVANIGKPCVWRKPRAIS